MKELADEKKDELTDEEKVITYLKNELRKDSYIELDKFNKNIENLSIIKNDIISDLIDRSIIFIDTINNNKVITLKERYILEQQIVQYIDFIKLKKIETLYLNIEDKLNILDEFNLNFEQRQAVIESIKNNITIIKGKAGTGKTTIVKAIIKLYKKLNKYGKINIVSFTGKAVNRIMEDEILGAQTIHKFLGADLDDIKDKNIKLKNTNLLIIDEATMVDIKLFNLILKSVKNNDDIKIIMLGDTNQLNPITGGNVFKHLIDCKYVNIVRLKTVFRQRNDSLILKNSNFILRKQKNWIKFKDEFKFYNLKKDEEIKSLVLEKIRSFLDLGYSMDDIVVLCSKNKGTLGVEEMNDSIANFVNERYYRKEKGFVILDRVMNIKNDYSKRVFNGEEGIITELNINDITVSFKGKNIKYTKNESKEMLRLSYANTIHKMQGSQYKVVILLVGENDKMLNKNLIYVAVTRATEQFVGIGDLETFKNSIEKTDLRKTFINELIYRKKSNDF
ncbi:MAG: AAA family ATPase [Clostridium perfringens]|nr:AAA family ATPase [Clostridium perfringens]